MLDTLIRAREEALAREDDPHKTSGPLKFGSFLPDQTVDFPNASEMGSCVKGIMRNAEGFYDVPASWVDRIEFSERRVAYLSAYPENTVNDKVEVAVYGKLDVSKAAVVIVPHWNAQSDSYTSMARIISWAGHTALIVTLPHHLQRSRQPVYQVANDFLNADLGAAIKSVRQSVVDVRILVGWLHRKGVKDVHIIGASLGSCVASLVTAFDPRIRKCGLLLTAGDFAKTVWMGRATNHIHHAIQDGVTLPQLEEIWSIISPIYFSERFAVNKSKLLLINGTRDEVVKPQLTEEFVEKLERSGADFRRYLWPCGHYTLAKLPFSVAAVLCILRFLADDKKVLRRD